MKQANVVIDRILQGAKIEINTTTILLTAIIIILLAHLLEGGEKPKKYVISEKSKKN
jgi:hypothetical protein